MVVEIALEHTELSSRELAHKITDEQGVFISESSVYRILKQRDLIPAPNHFLLSAANEFKDKTEFVHQMWQTDFTYFNPNSAIEKKEYFSILISNCVAVEKNKR